MSSAEVIEFPTSQPTTLDDIVARSVEARHQWAEASAACDVITARSTDADEKAAAEARATEARQRFRAAQMTAAYALKETKPDILLGPDADDLAAIRAQLMALGEPEMFVTMETVNSEENQIFLDIQAQRTADEIDLRMTAPVPTPRRKFIDMPESIDDAHMAAAFADHLRGRYLYIATSRRWRRWDGRRWALDTTEAVFEEARQWVLELNQVMLDSGADSEKLKRSLGYRAKARLEAFVTLARRINGITATEEEFDRDPNLLNVANGIVDLRTGDLLPHDPARRMTRLAGANYRPEATHPDVDNLLLVVDKDVRDWLVTLFGYSATGHTTEDLIAVFDGGGANGKTTILEAVAAALGDYANPVPAQLIMRSSRDEHPTIKADLMGRRLVWVSETEENGSIRMEQLKALTGGDRIKARFMGRDFFEFKPTHTLVVATNHRPFVNATEHAAWRRLRLVPFPFTYKSADKAGPGDRVGDPKLRHRLSTGGQQREAMLAWIVAGAVSWKEHGFPPCPTIDNATDSWRLSEDVILRFITEQLEFDTDAVTRGQDLYNAYTDWCRDEGRPAKSNKNFAQELLTHETVEKAGVKRVTRQNAAFYLGVRTRANPRN